MSRHGLLDGDEIAFKVALQYQQTFYYIYKDDVLKWKYKLKEEAIESIGNRDDLEIKQVVEVFDMDNRLDEKIDSFISKIRDNTSISSYTFCLSGDNNFRYSLATLLPYKGNRTTEKPYYINLVKDRIEDMHDVRQVTGLEADDVMTALYQKMHNTIICSTDKDLRTVPSLNYNITTGLLQQISPELADANFYYQLLMGDAVDNIPSPYLLGETKVTKFLTGLYGATKEKYISSIIPFYSSFLLAKDKEGNYKTKWYDGRGVEEVLWEVGNLLWMHRTFDREERWSLYD